jgi:uncharacterized protein YbjT (DUF2867 family)
MVTQRNVIVFGATGDVGSAAALQAHQEGAKVSLAVRDPKKPIPRLSGIQFDKIPADLSKPETVEAAVQQATATVAFIYVVGDDNMRPSLQALKTGGIESVVFLSSFTVEDDPHAVPSTDYIAFHHAQVEIALEEVFGNENFVAIRPAYFSSNSLNFKNGILGGEVKLPNPHAEFDWISPTDVGRVSGSILAHGSKEHAVRLVGSEKLALKDAMGVIGDVLGRSISVTKIGAAEALEQMRDLGMPMPVANWMLNDALHNPGACFRAPGYLKALGNVHNYTGKAPDNLKQWVEENKERFEA